MLFPNDPKDTIIRYMHGKNALSFFKAVDLGNILESLNLSAIEAKTVIEDLTTNYRYAFISGHENLGSVEQNKTVEIAYCQIQGYLSGYGLMYVEGDGSTSTLQYKMEDVSQATFSAPSEESTGSVVWDIIKVILGIVSLLMTLAQLFR